MLNLNLGKKKIIGFRLFFYSVVSITLLLLPANFFNDGEDLCLSKVFFDIECYACGMTRAIMHCIHLEFYEAFYYNSLSFIVFPILCFLWSKWIYEDLKSFNEINKAVK